MIRPVALLVVTTVALSGCSRLAESRINPMNWFGSRTPNTTVYDPGTAPDLIPASADVVTETRPLIDRIAQVELARTPSGGILRATGIAAAQGYFNAELVLASVEQGTATYDFRAEMPNTVAVQGPVATREITVAKALSDAELAGIRQIVVRGASNSASTR